VQPTDSLRSPLLQALHASSIQVMKIKIVRDDIKEIADNVLSKQGFVADRNGLFLKEDKAGNHFFIDFDEVKDRSAFSISVSVSANYRVIDEIFPLDETDPEFSLNCRLGSESISFEDYTKDHLTDIVCRLSDSMALPFLSKISTESKVIENLTSEDSADWITSDIVARFKFKFASAIIKNNHELLSNFLNEADKALSKLWADQYKIPLTKLCECARKSM